jgi:IS30 family transposase
LTRKQIFNAGVNAARNSEQSSNHNKPWSKLDTDLFLEMIENGCSAKQIATKLNRSVVAIYGKARYFNVKIKKASGDNAKKMKLSESDVKQIKRLRERGWSRMEVATLFNVHLDYVTHITSGFRRNHQGN